MAFKMKAGPEGPFRKNFPGAFKDNGKMNKVKGKINQKEIQPVKRQQLTLNKEKVEVKSPVWSDKATKLVNKRKKRQEQDKSTKNVQKRINKEIEKLTKNEAYRDRSAAKKKRKEDRKKKRNKKTAATKPSVTDSSQDPGTSPLKNYEEGYYGE